MIRGVEAILLSSEDGQKLADFYREKVGLKLGQEMEIGENDEKGFEFELSGVNLYIMDHSEVKGKSHDPSRVMFNLEVDDIEKEVKRLDKEGVKKIQDIYHIEGYGLIATYEDIDGNYFQFVQIKAS
ncbi:hypothetical protein A2362_03495 [Candidatus Curtissbacteria bacterium RIFOXYB1_FULL_41_59]|uniref:VOC domain-containing protein n=1 Tax=Candidatus Curtissbacteria bacterium RIFOXYA1_FULL_41_14 TaxID=1797737 RepID=A0A1F5HAE3_9BACT|nr:MAG: hypothetical protein UU00_C0010G0007 [Microgenomates group bacterium GW2011_GWC1_40_35]KKS01802.1 MAG: hypothetical protein UU53_C0007G0012 [Candidatus Curtissbacteria bacterium GW2011_GWC2_41_21]OGD92424.1 MAG: hypothetical protein A3E14_01060 [Candidatus Curtissbacteria bacterium RIFCSPHIGHO2_12_FULL_41_13]OGE01133.1 MAG: hypothetical protein A2196_00275 [Candidatus Curtissbacteria bacterium RIFOXYA1_FULL_41_14]OGE04810.1 MAG: hypothetical protein A2362_03495 [Candidatus Curtissbacter